MSARERALAKENDELVDEVEGLEEELETLRSKLRRVSTIAVIGDEEDDEDGCEFCDGEGCEECEPDDDED